jgi:hypothetical protein
LREIEKLFVVGELSSAMIFIFKNPVLRIYIRNENGSRVVLELPDTVLVATFIENYILIFNSENGFPMHKEQTIVFPVIDTTIVELPIANLVFPIHQVYLSFTDRTLETVQHLFDKGIQNDNPISVNQV